MTFNAFCLQWLDRDGNPVYTLDMTTQPNGYLEGPDGCTVNIMYSAFPPQTHLSIDVIGCVGKSSLKVLDDT